jgi:MFS transporter, MHS family, proline/betaine transporter
MSTDATSPRQSATRTALAGLIGNVLEWFDFAVYSYFATEIGQVFFPSTAPTAQLLKSYGVLAIGFFARPVGSLVLGKIGDHIGRRALLTVSIALMGGATLALGLLPSYAQIGVAAPILLIVCRLVQGFSLGGEFTGSMVYTTELASPTMRGLVSSSTAAGTTLGFILGSGAATLISKLMDKADIASYGWRIPFVASVLLCVAGWFLRNGIDETAEGKLAAAARPPLWPSIRADRLPMIRTFGIVALTNAAYYFTFTFAVDKRKTGADGSAFQVANTACLFVVLFAKPLGGWLSDRLGRRRMMIALTVVITGLVFVGLPLMLDGSPGRFAVGQILLGVPIGMALGLQGAMVVEIFPLRTRVTSMSMAYSITLAIAGGTAGLISTWLIATFGTFAPQLYIALYGVIGLAILMPMPETNTLRLDQPVVA